MADTPDTPRRGSAGLNTTNRARRNDQMAAEHARGDSWAAIAARHGVSERQARRAGREALASAAEGDPLVIEPAALLARVVRTHQRALARLEALADDSDNDSAAVGAARGAASVAVSLLDVLARVGLLPDVPAAWRHTRDAQALAEAVVVVAERRGLPVEEVLAEFERQASRGVAVAEVAA